MCAYVGNNGMFWPSSLRVTYLHMDGHNAGTSILRQTERKLGRRTELMWFWANLNFVYIYENVYGNLGFSVTYKILDSGFNKKKLFEVQMDFF